MPVRKIRGSAEIDMRLISVGRHEAERIMQSAIKQITLQIAKELEDHLEFKEVVGGDGETILYATVEVIT